FLNLPADVKCPNSFLPFDLHAGPRLETVGNRYVKLTGFCSVRKENTGMSSQVSQAESLEEILQTVRNPVELLRNSQIGPYAFPVVRYEFTNWRDEQRSWRETCALFDQSHHMTDVYVEGPDALKVFSDLGINSFKNFKV